MLAAFVIFLVLYSAFPTSHPVALAFALALVVGMIQSPSLVQRQRWQAGGGIRVTVWLPTVILVSGLAALLLDGWSLRNLARRLHTDAAVRQVATVDLNGLEIDADQGLLFANGHGTNRLLAYKLRALEQAPQQSEAEVGFAQGFAYDRSQRELYVFNAERRDLMVLDATTLALKKTVPGLALSEGDCFIAVDTQSDTIIIASEAGWPAREPGRNDDPSVSPIVVVERTTGRPVYALQWCDDGFCNPGHILLHQNNGLMYMGFIDRILAYDTRRRRVTARIQVGERWIGDRLALTPDQAELLYPSPLHSAVLKFDAQTLEFKGRIPTVFGVRGLTVDPVRNLLLTASGFTNMLDVIDLKTEKRVAKYYVAPWLRTIALDVKAGIAYISSVEGLFMVDYKARL
jgi:DNA-binding beta-propeller fold protein YncE